MTDSSMIRVTAVDFILLLVAIFLPTVCHGQLPSSRCDANKTALADCTYLTQSNPPKDEFFSSSISSLRSNAMPGRSVESTTEEETNTAQTANAPAPPQKESFHWRRALTESFTFLLIEQAYVVHTDFNWVVSENGVPFNHYWRDYKQSLSEWTQSGWNDGDPNWFGYVGHPIQGALTGFIEIQNDPQAQGVEFSRTKAYWWSRLKAGLWNAAYSTQWNLGPLSEVTVEKYGTKDRAPWTYAGTFPCTHHCLTGVGQIDIVMTPLGGTGWLIAEDFLDSKVVRRVENATDSRFLIDTLRCALNPVRGGANILHGRQPWYRDRDVLRDPPVDTESAVVSTTTKPTKAPPDHGDVFFGYSHLGTVHCEVPLSGAVTTCDLLSGKASALSGWSAAVEKKYLRYFGAVADFSAQYGSASQTNFLFGIRGGASIARLRPYAQALIGAVRARTSSPTATISGTSFAEDLGAGADFRLTRLLNWRDQLDVLKTGAVEFERYNVRVATGLAVRF